MFQVDYTIAPDEEDLIDTNTYSWLEEMDDSTSFDPFVSDCQTLPSTRLTPHITNPKYNAKNSRQFEGERKRTCSKLCAIF